MIRKLLEPWTTSPWRVYYRIWTISWLVIAALIFAAEAGAF